MKLELNQQEVTALIQLLDAALRFKGIDAAEAVTHFMRLIKQAEEANVDTDSQVS